MTYAPRKEKYYAIIFLRHTRNTNNCTKQSTSYTHESLYNYAAEIVRHNILLAGNVFYHEIVSLQ